MGAEGEVLTEVRPDDVGSFCVSVRALVGPLDGEGEESFDFTVCTPTWLESQEFDKGFWWGRHFLLVKRWDAATVEHAIRDVCVRAEGPDWTAVAERIARYGYWEFEDYRPSQTQ
jgi:Immunity protein 8